VLGIMVLVAVGFLTRFDKYEQWTSAGFPNKD
jgi:hypothetical protein